MGEGFLLTLILGISVLGLLVAWWLARWVLSRGTGTPAMQAISNAIKEGAESFLRRQNRTILMLAALGCLQDCHFSVSSSLAIHAVHLARLEHGKLFTEPRDPAPLIPDHRQ